VPQTNPSSLVLRFQCVFLIADETDDVIENADDATDDDTTDEPFADADADDAALVKGLLRVA
jgi:hypothetical protein